MSAEDAQPRPSTPRRQATRRRRVLVLAIAGVLTWAGVSFLADVGGVAANVSVVPGAAADGSVAEVRGLTTATVTSSKGGSAKLVGVKFARVDVAMSSQDKVRLTFAWQNAGEFVKETGSRSWQVRIGVYYPVHTGNCLGSEPAHAVNVTLVAAESYNGSVQTFCAYRDLDARGLGAVTTAGHEDKGTQLMAADFLVSTLQPQTLAGAFGSCAATGTTPCAPAGLGADRRPYLVIGSLLNPGGNVPPGATTNLTSMDLFVRATKAVG